MQLRRKRWSAGTAAISAPLSSARLVRPRALETIDFEGIYRTLDVDGTGAVGLNDFLGCILMHCENNQANDRQIFIKIEKMVSAMKSADQGFRDEVRNSQLGCK